MDLDKQKIISTLTGTPIWIRNPCGIKLKRGKKATIRCKVDDLLKSDKLVYFYASSSISVSDVLASEIDGKLAAVNIIDISGDRPSSIEGYVAVLIVDVETETIVYYSDFRKVISFDIEPAIDDCTTMEAIEAFTGSKLKSFPIEESENVSAL